MNIGCIYVKKSLENQLYRIFELADRNKIAEYIKYFNSLNFKDFYGDFFSIDEKILYCI